MIPFRFALLALGLAASAGIAAVARGGPGGGEGGTRPASPTWKEIERLKSDQKFNEALARVELLRSEAQAGGRTADWRKALLEAAELRAALGEFAGAIDGLRQAQWPPDDVSQAALSLHLGASLRQYLGSYGWEVRQRERIAGEGPFDLATATAERIGEEAVKAYSGAWSRREALGARLAADLPGMTRGTYPPEIRGTLRDSLTYLVAALLADTSLWTPEQLAERHLLDAARLAGPEPPAAAPDAFAEHPLARAAATLSDLERWHRAAGRHGAELEALLERVRILEEGFPSEADRRAVRAALEARLPAFRPVPWWSEGMATLAGLVQAVDEPGATAKAHALAAQGAAAWPGSSGARRCAAILEQIEAPEYSLAGMATDSPGQRSIEVTHRNLARLHFRAFAVDLEARLATVVEQEVWPAGDELQRLARQGRPVAEWTVELPPTPDWASHRTFVTPPLAKPGAYLVVSSVDPGFGERHNRLQAVRLFLSDLVLLEESRSGSQFFVRAISGTTGKPALGAEVTVYRVDWRQPAVRLVSAKAGVDGLLVLPVEARQGGSRFLLLGRWNGQIAFRAGWRSTWEPPAPSEELATLLFTDRALYRPGQIVKWKGLVYRGRRDTGPLAPVEGHELTVALEDTNGEVVATARAATNAFGTAAGELAIPTGRLLGDWRLTAEPDGVATIGVEEYKRPTFEVELLDSEAPLRLHQTAKLRAEARYLFGLPLPEGRASWRVEREPVLPPWLFWFSGKGVCTCFRFPLDTRTLTVATGSAPVGTDGRVEIAFTPDADVREKGSGLTYRYRVQVEVTDAGGETRSASRSFRLGWAEVEARIEGDGGFVPSGRAASLRAVREDLDGVPRPGSASWRLVRLVQPESALLPAERPAAEEPEAKGGAAPYRTPGDRLRPRWASEPDWQQVVADWEDGDEVAHGELVHGADGRAALPLPALSPGAYRIRYSTRDGAGEVAEARRELLVAGGAEGRIALSALLLAERAVVHVGETARLLVHSGRPGQTLYVDLFRGGEPLWREVRVATPTPTVIELPVGESDRGGFSVRLSAVADHQLLVSDLSIDVPRDDRELKLELTTFRDLLEPGQRETWRVSVRDAAGKPLGAGAAELLASMYDRSLDAFRPFAPPRPRRLFPVRTGLPGLSSTLGPGERGGWWGTDWNTLTTVESFAADSLTWLSGYGIGGPGGRFLETAALGGVRGGMAMPVAAAPQAMKSAPAPATRSAPAADAIAETVTVAAEGAPPPVTARTDFAETAFFEPHLLTGPDGSVAIEFKVPEALTTWRFWLSAVTRDLSFGSLEAEAKTRKELMVRPYLPRFLREGDEARLEVVVNNASAGELAGEAQLAIRDAESGEDLTANFGLAPADLRRPFRVAAGGGESLAFRLVAPRRLGRVAVEVTARAGERSDGERRPLPVLPARVHLVQSRFAALRDADRRELDFPDLRAADPTRIDEKLVVTVDGQLFAGMLAALPYLADYPYECTEQTLNRFLSTGMVASLFERRPELAALGRRLAAERTTPLEAWKADDPNRRLALEETPWLELSRGGPAGGEWLRVLDPQVALAQRESALARLREAQLPSGAFPWFPGGPPSPYMTLYLMYGFAKAAEFGVPVPRDLVEKGWRYLARDFREQWLRDLKKGDCCWEYLTFLGYVASSYPDPAWAAAGLDEKERREILDRGFAHWREHSPMLKLMLSMTLERAGRHADAKKVLDSVFDSARTTRDEGTFWKPEERSWLWYRDSIETHAWALRALLEVEPADPRRDGLVQWLFLNRQLNHWKSTRATAEVLYSVARHLEKEGTLLSREEVRVAAAGRAARFVFEPERFEGTQRQLLVPGEALAATSAPTVMVEKETKGLAFASATWSFSTEQPPATGRGDLFAVERRYFRRVRQGRETVLEPLGAGARLAVGDELEVQLSLSSRMGAEYVHLRDPRAAGLEPDRPGSGWRWDLGVARYEETRDSATNFFFEQLPAGEYTLKYRLRAATAGTFKVGPATVQSMYAPEFAAYSGAATLAIAGGPERH